jgi:FKBP-type peptidyl-prolyl cis-trans isomerase (trigger factor)
MPQSESSVRGRLRTSDYQVLDLHGYCLKQFEEASEACPSLDRLKTILRENLGKQLEFESNETLRQRVDELASANVRCQDENARLTNQVAELVNQVRETDDELMGARNSLRGMIREHSQ